METFLASLAHLLSGIIFCLSLYVVLRNLKRWRFDKEKLLPLHVWTITISYNLVIARMLFENVELGLPFYLYLVALVMGVYSLLILFGFQRKRKRALAQDDLKTTSTSRKEVT